MTQETNRPVEPGSFWIHSSGRRYAVFAIANAESTDHERYPPTVVYFDGDRNIWSRPLSDWHRSMTHRMDELIDLARVHMIDHGINLICEFHELVGILPDCGKYEVKHVRITRQQYEDTPEFEG